jgi:hypothetical protein
MKHDATNEAYKILPKNRSPFGLNGSEEVVEDKYSLETPKNNEDENFQNEFRENAKKFMLYKKFHSLVELPSENEHITANFLNHQAKHFNLVKFKESYANFLIDVTLILHDMDILYKTNLECDKTRILIDIAIPNLQIAVLFEDTNDCVCSLSNEKRTYHRSPFSELKLKILEESGWKVISIPYEVWSLKHDSKTKKENDLRRLIEELSKEV